MTLVILVTPVKPDPTSIKYHLRKLSWHTSEVLVHEETFDKTGAMAGLGKQSVRKTCSCPATRCYKKPELLGWEPPPPPWISIIANFNIRFHLAGGQWGCLCNMKKLDWYYQHDHRLWKQSSDEIKKIVYCIFLFRAREGLSLSRARRCYPKRSVNLWHLWALVTPDQPSTPVPLLSSFLLCRD